MTKEDTFVRMVFELLPIFLAALSFVYTGLQISNQKGFKRKVIFTIACLNSAMLIFAQMSWTYTVYIGDTIGTLLANYTWTIFNSSVMVSYLLLVSDKNTEEAQE